LKEKDLPDKAGSIDSMQFQAWVIEQITSLKKDVEWIKKILSPITLLAILSTILMLILKLLGR
jgi:hypothetical protein